MDAKTQEEQQPDKTNGKDIARVAGYRRWDLELAVIRINPQDHENIRDSISQPFDRAPLATLGRLEKLPLEVLCEICPVLDIQSLFRFRQLNRRAREVVNAVQEYRLVTTHVLEVLCVILRTQVASWFTLHGLASILRTYDCLACGSFGGFIFLPTFTRCCSTCLVSSPRFGLIQPKTARKKYRWTLKRIRSSMPTLRTVPGVYSVDKATHNDSIDLLPGQKFADRGASESMIFRYMAATSLPYLETLNDDIGHGISCVGCQVAIERDIADLAAEDSIWALRDRVYSTEKFLEHFQSCPEAQELWKSSKEGTIPVKVPELVRRRSCIN